MKQILLILFAGTLLFAQQDKLDTVNQIRKLADEARANLEYYYAGKVHDMVLTEAQKADLLEEAEQNLATIGLLVGSDVQVIETVATVEVKATIDPAVITGLQYFIDNADTRFYKGNRQSSVNKIQAVLDLLK